MYSAGVVSTTRGSDLSVKQDKKSEHQSSLWRRPRYGRRKINKLGPSLPLTVSAPNICIEEHPPLPVAAVHRRRLGRRIKLGGWRWGKPERRQAVAARIVKHVVGAVGGGRRRGIAAGGRNCFSSRSRRSGRYSRCRSRASAAAVRIEGASDRERDRAGHALGSWGRCPALLLAVGEERD